MAKENSSACKGKTKDFDVNGTIPDQNTQSLTNIFNKENFISVKRP